MNNSVQTQSAGVWRIVWSSPRHPSMFCDSPIAIIAKRLETSHETYYARVLKASLRQGVILAVLLWDVDGEFK